jgi:hypothetical protein
MARDTPHLDVEALVTDPTTRIIVCCGAGGVGKTTLAAAIGVRAAESGRRVVTLTIDPAKRLAQALGLTELDNTPRKVAGVKASTKHPDGELHAMMLDMKRTFDEIVEAHASPVKAAQILANPFYQSLSSSFAGTQEYMAMEKLGQLRKSDRWDLIVVDTPPARSALDFLDAPGRLARFLDGRFIRMLLVPAHAGRARHGDRNDDQAARHPAAHRGADVRRRDGHHVRRFARTRGHHGEVAPDTGHSFRGRRRAGARFAARSLLLRRTARRGRDAARRCGDQPGAPQLGAVAER